jgi:RHS repeat-associated protein
VQQKRYRYTGKERDDSSGLCHYGARYLAPWLTRWISPDAEGGVGASKNGKNGAKTCQAFILFFQVHILSLRIKSKTASLGF